MIIIANEIEDVWQIFFFFFFFSFYMFTFFIFAYLHFLNTNLPNRRFLHEQFLASKYSPILHSHAFLYLQLLVLGFRHNHLYKSSNHRILYTRTDIDHGSILALN